MLFKGREYLLSSGTRLHWEDKSRFGLEPQETRTHRSDILRQKLLCYGKLLGALEGSEQISIPRFPHLRGQEQLPASSCTKNDSRNCQCPWTSDLTQLHRKFEATQGYMRSCLKTRNNNKKMILKRVTAFPVLLEGGRQSSWSIPWGPSPHPEECAFMGESNTLSCPPAWVEAAKEEHQ